MPTLTPKPCRHPGCAALVASGGYCEAHKRVAPGSFADRARGSRHERGYGSQWDRLRASVMARDAGLCVPCRVMGRASPARAVDHVVPKSQGGTDELDNLQAICIDCHREKTARESAQGRGTSKV